MVLSEHRGTPKIPYEVCVTAVSDRLDLYDETMSSLLKYVDQEPEQVTVHVDVRDGTPLQGLHASRVLTTAPPGGMGPALLKLLEQASTDFVLYTQEDWLVLRDLPVSRTLQLMQEHGLHHVRWNKRKTMPAKHEDRPDARWAKVEVDFDGQTLCVADHWYTQTSMWRVAEILPVMQTIAPRYPQAHEFVARLNDAMNTRAGARGKQWRDQGFRHERLKTYIWGPVGEPAFVKHVGSIRGTGNIKNHFARST